MGFWICGPVAQLGEHLVCNQGVRGSNPLRSTNAFLGISRPTILLSLREETPQVWMRWLFQELCNTLSKKSQTAEGALCDAEHSWVELSRG